MSDKDIELPAPNDAVSAVAFSPVDPDLLLSACWDSTVTLYNVNAPDITKSVKATFPHLGAVLDASFSGKNDGGKKAYTGGLDRNIREIDLSTGEQTLLGHHEDAVRCVKWSDSMNLLVSASWDSCLRIWDPRSTPSNNTLWTPLPAKAFSMDVSDNSHKVIVACAQRHIITYDMRNLSAGIQVPTDARKEVEPSLKKESSLKFMTRCVRINPTGDAFASTSIEGRVAVDFFDQAASVQAKKYAFKCHRAVVNGTDTVFPVNALAFHPIHGTFATGGGDGVVSVWDLAAKKRLRQFPKYPCSVSSLSFNSDGTRLAVAGSVFLEEGTGSSEGRKNAIWLREGSLFEECRPKSTS